MTDRDDDGDPLLVRPYLLDEPGGTAPAASTQTWPEAAAQPAAGAESPDPTVPIRLPAPPPRRGRRPRVLLVAAALTLALIGAAGLTAALLPEHRRPRALPIDVPLPSPAVPSAAPAASAASATAAPATAAATRPRAVGSPPATSTPGPKPAPRSTKARRGAAPAATTVSPAADRLIPPPADRVGRISGAGDLCLDLPGALAVDGTRVQVFTCNDTAAQRWTVAADGTLRIVGKCAAAAGDGTVHIAGCAGGSAQTWRAGPDGSLVSPATGGCLTDPGGGTRSGAAVRVEECSAADGQRWKLP